MDTEEKLSFLIQNSLQDGRKALSYLFTEEALIFMKRTMELLASAFRSGNKVIICGNGGSLCDAAHFAEELTGCFRKPRKALPAIVLSEAGHLTCVGNDFGFDHVFERGVEAFGAQGDVFIGLTTSGNSKNIILALKAARDRGMSTLLFLGKGGGSLLGQAEYQLVIPECTTSDRIQEAHMMALHIIIEGVEALLF